MPNEKVCKNCGKTFVPCKNDERILFCGTECRKEYRFKTGYMKAYHNENKDKWKQRQMTEEYRNKKNAARRKKYATDAEFRKKHKESVKRYQEENPEVRLNQRMKKFGITAEKYHELMERQGGVCAICGTNIGDNNGNRLYVDHDHKNGRVRGLLCMKCNMGIGQFCDNTELMRNAIKYLEESEWNKC